MLRRNELVNAVKQVLLNRESDLKWAMAYGDYEEPFREIAEDIVERVLSFQHETPIS
jgi:hypothetical protein